MISNNNQPNINQNIGYPIIELVLLHCLHCPDVFTHAYGKLAPEHLTRPGEQAYCLTWHAILQYYERYNHLPTYPTLSAMVVNATIVDPLISQEVAQAASNFVEWLFSKESEADKLQPEAAIDWLRTLLLDRRVGQPIRQVVTSTSCATLLPALIEEMDMEVRQINLIHTHPDGIVVPEIWGDGSPPRDVMPTGVPFIDARMTTYRGDVNVILGPTGVGKSTLMIQLLTNMAQIQHQQQLNGKSGGLCAYFGYETDISDHRARVISCAANIRKDRLKQIKSYDELSTSTKLEPYERELYRTELAVGRAVLGERERMQRVTPWLNEHLRVFDFSGHRYPGQPVQGFGGIKEIRRELEHHAQKTGKDYAVIGIDWAGMLIRRNLEFSGKDLAKYMSLELLTFIDRVHTEIAEPFGAIVYVAHQLRGQAKRLGPTAKVTDADAEWCSSFAVNAWNSIVLGNKDEDTSTCVLRWTKTRDGREHSIVCLINGAFGKLEETNDYMLDEAQRRIVSIHDRATHRTRFDVVENRDDVYAAGFGTM